MHNHPPFIFKIFLFNITLQAIRIRLTIFEVVCVWHYIPMKLSQTQLEQRIRLVKWEEGVQRQRFNLTTIHSLLLDSNPKFVHLRQIIQKFNQETSPARIKLKQSYVHKLFKMLSQLTRIPISENQLEYLNKIYQWATSNAESAESFDAGAGDKMRPVTATTKARSQSAYSRATSRPISGTFQKRTVRNDELPPLNTNDPKIDYTRLKEGEKEFYCGLRSIHPEYDHPRKRLKDYQRKIFYEDDADSDVEIIDVEPAVVLNQQKLIEEIELAQEEEGGEAEEGLGENEENAENAEVNVDDIPIEGEEEAAAEGQPEEPQEIVDKLRPTVKAYNNPKGLDEYNHKNYYEGMVEIRRQQNHHERRVDEDVQFAQLGAMWAQGKGRAKSELKRRAESARMFKNKIGITYEKPPIQREKQRENIINFDNVVPHNVNTKGQRPLTAFTAANSKTREELIRNAFITGKLSGHVKKYEPGTALSIPSEFNIIGETLVTHSGPPKKKTFEQILRQAEERVIKESQEEVVDVKEAFAKSKISIGANKIAKSISYNEKQLPEGERFTGLITGMTMLKNPFIKIAKKKKKKKKK